MLDYDGSNRAASDRASFEIVRDSPPAGLDQAWRKCLEDVDSATHYTTPEYFHEPFFRGKQPFAVLSLIGQDVVAVCTGIHDGRWLRCGLSERPQVAIARGADLNAVAAGLAAGLREESRSSKLVDVFSWSQLDRMTHWGFNERQEQGAIVLDLSLGADALFRSFSQTRRTDIRNAIRAGVTVYLAASSADVSEAYDVYTEWAARKGLSPVPRGSYVEAVALSSNRRLFIARHQGKMVANLVVRFAPGGMMEAAAIVALEEQFYLHPNDLLHFRAIEWACGQELRVYSLGASHLFARRFGGSLVPTYRYRLDRTFLKHHAIRDAASGLMQIGAAYAPSSLVGFARRLRHQSRS
jgi:hypothetical protein